MLPRSQVILTPLGGQIWAPSLQTWHVEGAGAPGPSTLSSKAPRLQGAEMLHCVQHDMVRRLRCAMDAQEPPGISASLLIPGYGKLQCSSNP